jgi:hypothetical protein
MSFIVSQHVLFLAVEFFADLLALYLPSPSQLHERRRMSPLPSHSLIGRRSYSFRRAEETNYMFAYEMKTVMINLLSLGLNQLNYRKSIRREIAEVRLVHALA